MTHQRGWGRGGGGGLDLVYSAVHKAKAQLQINVNRCEMSAQRSTYDRSEMMFSISWKPI